MNNQPSYPQSTRNIVQSGGEESAFGADPAIQEYLRSVEIPPYEPAGYNANVIAPERLGRGENDPLQGGSIWDAVLPIGGVMLIAWGCFDARGFIALAGWLVFSVLVMWGTR